MAGVKRVAVTGGSGQLGRYVVEELRTRHEVTVLDRVRGPDGVKFISVDMLDREGVLRALEGHDALVHLAAVDSAVPAPEHVYFQTNVLGTWHVLEGARAQGIHNAVVCSSVSAVGIRESEPAIPPVYLPIDEDHPLRPSTAYGLSKQAAEHIAAGFARAGDMRVTCLRPVWIAYPDLVASVEDRVLAADSGVTAAPNRRPSGGGAAREPLSVLRAYVRPEDAAGCVRRSLEVDGPAHEVFFVAAGDTFSPAATLDGVERRFGGLPEVRDPARFRDNPRASPFSTQRARQRLGWEPAGDWSSVVAQPTD